MDNQIDTTKIATTAAMLKTLPRYVGYSSVRTVETLNGSEGKDGWVVLELYQNGSYTRFVIGKDDGLEVHLLAKKIEELEAQVGRTVKLMQEASQKQHHEQQRREGAERDVALVRRHLEDANAKLKDMEKIQGEMMKIRDTLGAREVTRILETK